MTKPTIKFKQTQLLNFSWQLKESISFNCERGNQNYSVVLSPLDEREREIYKKQFYFSKCEVLIERRANESNYEIFEDMLKNKYSHIKKNLTGYSSYNYEDAEYIIPQLSFFKQSFQEYIKQSCQLLSNVITDTLYSFRWVFNIEGTHILPGKNDTYWSINNSVWHIVPSRMNIDFSLGNYPEISNNKGFINSAIELVKSGQKEPIYHALFREAWHQRNLNKVSSIVIGIASLEIAVKQCIGTHINEAKWLIEKLISPPVEKLIFEYIPTIIKDTIVFSDQTKKDIKDGVKIRNEVVHLGKNIPDIITIERILTTIKKLLWQLDIWNGNDWAKNYLDNKSRNRISL